MESHVKLLGHPVHPMLIVLPLGLLSSAVLFDAIYLITGNDALVEVAFWNITLGVIGGLAAAIFGAIDWWAIPRETRAKQIGLVHGGGNVVVVGLFLVSWLLRLPDHAYAPNLLPFVLGLVAVILALGTAWLGGELVFRLRVGVDHDASLNAPSSLSGSAGSQRESGETADAAG